MPILHGLVGKGKKPAEECACTAARSVFRSVIRNKGVSVIGGLDLGSGEGVSGRASSKAAVGAPAQGECRRGDLVVYRGG